MGSGMIFGRHRKSNEPPRGGSTAAAVA
jgi:hypothetical protein